jgi:hypothetical protein
MDIVWQVGWHSPTCLPCGRQVGAMLEDALTDWVKDMFRMWPLVWRVCAMLEPSVAGELMDMSTTWQAKTLYKKTVQHNVDDDILTKQYLPRVLR